MIVDCGPPGNRNGKSAVQAPFPKRNFNNSPTSTAVRAPLQPIWARWCREAGRLFGLYWSSGDLKHFQAFGRHIDAMRIYGGPRR